MTDADLMAVIRACTADLEAEHGPTWRNWLAENDPEAEAAYRQLEREGVEL